MLTTCKQTSLVQKGWNDCQGCGCGGNGTQIYRNRDKGGREILVYNSGVWVAKRDGVEVKKGMTIAELIDYLPIFEM